MSSTITFLVIAAVLIVAAIIVAAILYHQQQAQRRRHLREHFGPEYDRLVAATGSSRAAERELNAREQRAAAYQIRSLSPEERAGFATRWQQIQAGFVDNPKVSLAHADDLLGDVLCTRGYPVQDFEQRAADLSVDHPVVVLHYYVAHGIALRHKKDQATTEDLRQAMIHYRTLFQELVSNTAPALPLHVSHAAE